MRLEAMNERNFLAVIILSVLGVFCLIASITVAFSSPMDDVQKGTLMIYSGDGKGFCSGTLIAPDLILSAAHCADAGEGVNVRVQTLDERESVLSEKLVYVKPLRTLKGWDVALFTPKGRENFVEAFGDSVAVIDVATADEAKGIKFGDRVIAVGYPKAFQLQITDGLWSGMKFLTGLGYEHPVYKISAPITGGNSGGGLYLIMPDKSLKLLGVNVAGIRDVSFMNYAASYDAIMAVTQGFVSAEFAERAKDDKPGSGTDGK